MSMSRSRSIYKPRAIFERAIFINYSFFCVFYFVILAAIKEEKSDVGLKQNIGLLVI